MAEIVDALPAPGQEGVGWASLVVAVATSPTEPHGEPDPAVFARLRARATIPCEAFWARLNEAYTTSAVRALVEENGADREDAEVLATAWAIGPELWKGFEPWADPQPWMYRAWATLKTAVTNEAVVKCLNTWGDTLSKPQFRAAMTMPHLALDLAPREVDAIFEAIAKGGDTVSVAAVLEKSGQPQPAAPAAMAAPSP